MTAAGSCPPTGADPDMLLPAYGSTTLGGLMPSAAAALGLHGYADRLQLLPGGGTVQRVCTVLVDGMGASLLAERGGHAPFLRRASQDQAGEVPGAVAVGVPSTTATSMASLGTSLPPGGHGLIGYQVLDPARDRLHNHLSWSDDVDPLQWQPAPTVFETVVAAGVPVTMVGPAAFAGSGLTLAALRGAAYVAARTLEDRVEAALTVLRTTAGPQLVHVYWGELDTVGHGAGWRSDSWVAELERLDAALSVLARRLPVGTLLVVTADHGMVDCPRERRFDVAEQPELRRHVRHVAGEPRLLQLHTEAGRQELVRQRWEEALGDRAWVRSRSEAEAEGWFGTLTPDAAARVGNVLVAARADHAIVDTERDTAPSLRMVGQHGSLTPAEQVVPVLRVLR